MPGWLRHYGLPAGAVLLRLQALAVSRRCLRGDTAGWRTLLRRHFVAQPAFWKATGEDPLLPHVRGWLPDHRRAFWLQRGRPLVQADADCFDITDR